LTHTRALTARDERQVERFALMASFAPDRPLPEGAEEMAHVRRWLDDWRPLELGVCWEEHDGVVGAAWARRVEPILVRSASGQPVPQILMAVDPDRRGRGIGRALMEALIILAEEAGESSLCLSVSDENPGAVRLYERVGFVPVGDRRTGLFSMVLDLED
jgi:GNAT superfamily N-acetyltransferase